MPKAPQPSLELKERAVQVLKQLKKLYPNPVPQLEFDNPWQVMVATILAAQCTDERVNKVTPELYKRWPGPAQLAKAKIEDLEIVIRSTGLFRSKAKNLVNNAKRIMEHYNGQIPDSMKELVTLPGVARKTANIVLWAGFGKNEGMAVDTHVKRISFRLGFTKSTNPDLIERDMLALFPQDSWGDLNNRMVWFGRDVCSARNPACTACSLATICPRHGLDN